MDDPAHRAATLSRSLAESGHATAAEHLAGPARHHQGRALLEALREACQTVLTAVETLDPSSYNAVEELRLDLDRRLHTGKTSG